MVDVTYQMVLSTLQTLSIMVGISYYILALRNQTRAREAQVYTQIWDKFSDPEFLRRYFVVQDRQWTDFDDYIKQYGSLRYLDPELYAENVSVGVYYEGIGVLVKNGYIDVQTVADILGTMVLTWWDKMSPLMKEYRVKLNNPRAYLYAEYLYNKVKTIVEKEHPELKKSSPIEPPRPNP